MRRTTSVVMSQAAGTDAMIPRDSRYSSFFGLNLGSTGWNVMFTCGTEWNTCEITIRSAYFFPQLTVIIWRVNKTTTS